MPKELTIKIILGGSARSGKSSFINGLSSNINEFAADLAIIKSFRNMLENGQ